MEDMTNVYLCLLRGEYNVIRARSLEEASTVANEMGGFTLRRAFDTEWYADEDGINYMGD